MPQAIIVIFLLFFAVLAFAWFYLQRAKARDAAVESTDAAVATSGAAAVATSDSPAATPAESTYAAPDDAAHDHSDHAGHDHSDPDHAALIDATRRRSLDLRRMMGAR